MLEHVFQGLGESYIAIGRGCVRLRCGYCFWFHCMGLLPDTQNCGLRMRRERFPRHWLQRKPLVSDPGMHHGTCVTHVPWCMSGLLTRGDGENVPGICGACATRNLTHLVRGPLYSMPNFGAAISINCLCMQSRTVVATRFGYSVLCWNIFSQAVYRITIGAAWSWNGQLNTSCYYY